MAVNPQNRPNPNIQQRCDRILDDARVSRREYFQLVSLFLSDFSVTEEERRQLNSVFDNLQMGRLKLVD